MTAQPKRKAANKTAIAVPAVPQPPRMRAALREAVDLIVSKGLTQREAARRAGMNETSLGRALAKPHIAAFVEYEKALFASDMLKLKERAKVLAINVGIELMHSAQSEAVRARMVEMFAGEGKPGTQVNVQINNDRGGYEFVRPGSRIVEIAPSLDTQSSADDKQGLDNAE